MAEWIQVKDQQPGVLCSFSQVNVGRLKPLSGRL